MNDQNLENTLRNPENYPDPTPYEAIKNVDPPPPHRLKKVLRMIRAICDIWDFSIEGRIALKDERTGKVWK